MFVIVINMSAVGVNAFSFTIVTSIFPLTLDYALLSAKK